MGFTSFSGKRRRTYARKFDWGEARRMHAEGHTIVGIAAHLGVNTKSIRRALFGAKDGTTYDEPQFIPVDDRCPTCQGKKSPEAVMCRQCRNDSRLQPPRFVFVPGRKRTPLAGVELGRVVKYDDRWAVVEGCNTDGRYRTLHFWDGPPQRVWSGDFVESVLATRRSLD